MRQGLDQMRAASAWEAVESVKTGGKEYTAWVRKTPSLVVASGLGQTLAFLRAKGKEDQKSHYNLVYNHLSEWVLPQVRRETPNTPQERRQLLKQLLENDSDFYRQATAEALAYITWLKRFAEAKFGDVTDTEE